MKSLVFLFILPGISYSQVADKSDTLPQIKSTKEVCYQATSSSGSEVKLGKRQWYKWFLDDEYYEYNEDGVLIKSMSWDEDNRATGITLFEYANGEIKKLSNYELNEEDDTILTRYSVYYYDQMQFNYLDTTFRPDGLPNLITKNVKDYSQNVVFSKTTYPDGRFLSAYATHYNSDDDIIKVEDRNSDNSIESITYFSEDTVTRTSFYYTVEGDDTTSYTYSEYNEKDLITLEKHYTRNYSEAQDVFSFDYEYNDFGDWTRQLIFKEGKLEYVVIRTISYWD